MNDATSQLKEQLVTSLEGVEGFLQIEKAWELHERARTCPSAWGDLSVVEIGSWKGRSTIALARGLRARNGGTVHAIDPHTGSREHLEMWGQVDTYQEFLQNLDRAGVAHLVHVIRVTSHEARPRFADRSVHLLFVDGSHEYADVLQDIDDWIPALRDEAVVAFDDSAAPGVHRALRERVLRRNAPYRRPKLVGGTLFFEFRRIESWRRQDTIALLRLHGLLYARIAARSALRFLPADRLRSLLIRGGNRLSNRLSRG